MSRLIYLANIRLPTEKAHGIQIMEMCSAFAFQGFEVELVVPHRANLITADPFEYHDVERRFSIRRLPAIDLVRFGALGYAISLFSFTLAAALRYRRDATCQFYTRDPFIAVFFRVIGIRRIAWEAHRGERNVVVRALLALRIKIVVITEALRELYAAMGAPEHLLLVAPDGADIDRFDVPITRDEARKELSLPSERKIVLYKGHLYATKGAGTLAQAAPFTGDARILCVFIGGSDPDVREFKRLYGAEPKVSILGNKPRKETPIYQKAADLLVIPNSASDEMSKKFSSPMKLFGYMAARVPIVASDVPAIREVLSEETAFFFAPDDPRSLATAIDTALADPAGAAKKAERAFALVADYSWTRRAERILSFLT